MRQEVLVITAADIAAAQHGDDLGMRILELLAGLAPYGSLLVRIDFPGPEAAGGLEATPRRLTWLSRLIWKAGTLPCVLPR